MIVSEAKREAVAHVAKIYEVSERRTRLVLQSDRSLLRYKSNRGDDVEHRVVIKRVSYGHKRFAYRRVHVMVWCVLKTVLANKRAAPSSVKF